MAHNVLLTGASGFLGSALRRTAGPTVRVVPAGFRNPPPDAAETWLRLDVRDARAVDEAVARLRPSAVLHAAATMEEAQLEAVNAEGTRSVARAARAADAFLLHVSTDMVFDGEAPPYHEGSALSPNTAYGRSKARAEEIARAEGGRRLVARTSLLFAPSTDDPRTRRLLERIEAGEEVPLFTDEVRCPAHVEDVARALWRALADALEGRAGPAVAHLAGPEAMTRFEFGVALFRALGRGAEGIRASTIAESGLERPRDLTLVAPATPLAWRAPIRSARQALEGAAISSEPGAGDGA